jgi:Cu(I)/Ag(I) efflux system membrane protein CusA/SilA
MMKTRHDLADAVYEGAVKRVRPKVMTISVIIAGLLPILWSHGTHADVMKRIVASMVGGVITSGIMELAIYPVLLLVAGTPASTGRSLPGLSAPEVG